MREPADSEPDPSTSLALAGVVLSDDWFVVGPDLARGLEEQLGRELLPGHVLHGRRMVAALKSNVSDDVVFYERTPDGEIGGWWGVHLAWGAPFDNRWPSVVALPAPVAGEDWP